MANRIISTEPYAEALHKMGHTPKIRLLEVGIVDKVKFVEMVKADIEVDKPDLLFFTVFFPAKEVADLGIPIFVFPEHIPDPRLFDMPWGRKNVTILSIAPSFTEYFVHIGWPRNQIKNFSYASHHERLMPGEEEKDFDFDVVFMGTDGADSMRMATAQFIDTEEVLGILALMKEDTSKISLVGALRALRNYLGEDRYQELPSDMIGSIAFKIQDYAHLLRVRETTMTVYEHCKKMGYRFGLAGHGWKNFPEFKHIVEIDPYATAGIYHRSKVTYQRNSHTNSLSRFYKSVMSGCLPIVREIASDEESGGILTHYSKGNVLRYKNNFELIDLIDFNVNNLSARNVRLKRLQDETVERNCYESRFTEILR